MSKNKLKQTKEITMTLKLHDVDLKCHECGVTFHWSGYSGKYPKWCSSCKIERTRKQKREYQREVYKEMREALIKVREQEQQGQQTISKTKSSRVVKK